MGHMGDRVKPFRIVTVGILCVPLVDSYWLAPRELVELFEQLMYWTSPLKSG
jgi:hypothetical protein